MKILVIFLLVFCMSIELSAQFEEPYFVEFEDYYYGQLPFPEVDGIKHFVSSILDLLDENRSIHMKPEDFIYPFGVHRRPMLATILVDSVTETKREWATTKRARSRLKNSFVKELKSKHVKERFSRFFKDPNRGNQTLADRNILGSGDFEGDELRQKKITLPKFEITGTFGTLSQPFIVVGNRYYTLMDNLKGSRELRKTKFIQLDDRFAFFDYRDKSFLKRIKALDPAF